MRDKFLSWGIVVLIVAWATAFLIKGPFWIPILLTLIYLLGVYNTYQSKHAILRNFPVLSVCKNNLFKSLQNKQNGTGKTVRWPGQL